MIFLSTVALDCTDEVHEYHVMRKVLLNLPRDEQLRICDEYFFFEWSKIFLDHSLVIYDLKL